VRAMHGLDDQDGTLRRIRLCPESTPAANFGFDVTPARLVSGIITERGITTASREGLLRLYPEMADAR